jgi:hypothetical protein
MRGTTAQGGFCEMGFYSPDATGKPQLRAVVSRQCVKGKWCVYLAGNAPSAAQLRTRVKRLAVQFARAWAEDETRRARGVPVKQPELAQLVGGAI